MKRVAVSCAVTCLALVLGVVSGAATAVAEPVSMAAKSYDKSTRDGLLAEAALEFCMISIWGCRAQAGRL